MITTETPPTNHEKPEPWLTRGVLGIGTASFLADVGHEVPTALLPSLLASTLGAPAAALGVIEGIADGAAGCARLFGGALADDPERRRTTAVGGYTSTAIFSSLIGVASAAWQVGVLRVAAWTARGMRVPARNALLADVVPMAAYGRAYGFERAMDNLGAIAGPLLALGLVALVGVQHAIMLSVIPGLLAVLAIVYAIRQTAHPREHVRQPVRLQARPVFRGPLGRLMFGITAFEVGNVAATLLILRATQLLEPTMGNVRATQLALGLYIAYNSAATVTSIPAGRAGDRWGNRVVLLVGIAGFLLAYLGFALTPASLPLLMLCFLSAGVAIGCVETAEHAAVATLAPEAVRGSAFGVLAAIQGFGNLAASGVAGVLWTLVSGQAAFLYLVAWMLLALVGVLATGRSGRYAVV